MPKPPDTTFTCEAILQEERRYNEAHQILASENAIIDRLLSRRCELVEAYSELHQALGSRPHALRIFLGVVVTTAAFWNPEEVDEARAGRTRLKRINALIASKALELSTLLQERTHLHDHSGFSGSTHYHIAKVIEDAASDNHLFRMWVRDQLKALRAQFSLKYWPTLADFLSALAADAETAELEATDSITTAATAGARGSRADFFKALFAAIDANCSGGSATLPPRFRPTDKSLASLANCALDLGPDGIVDAGYVKRLRQRLRESAHKAAQAQALASHCRA
jgi:hypothetical protein